MEKCSVFIFGNLTTIDAKSFPILNFIIELVYIHVYKYSKYTQFPTFFKAHRKVFSEQNARHSCGGHIGTQWFNI